MICKTVAAMTSFKTFSINFLFWFAHTQIMHKVEKDRFHDIIPPLHSSMTNEPCEDFNVIVDTIDVQ